MDASVGDSGVPTYEGSGGPMGTSSMACDPFVLVDATAGLVGSNKGLFGMDDISSKCLTPAL